MTANVSYSVTFLGTFNNNTPTKISFSAVVISPFYSMLTFGSTHGICGGQSGIETSLPPITTIFFLSLSLH
jgi:hypothetical protein